MRMNGIVMGGGRGWHVTTMVGMRLRESRPNLSLKMEIEA